MAQRIRREQFTAQGGELLDRVKQLIHEGNVRRVVITHDGHTVAEFPLTVGVVGALVAPVLAAVGALAAVLTECTIEVERIDDGAGKDGTEAGDEMAGTATTGRQ